MAKLLWLLTAFFFCFCRPALAADEFSTDYRVSYRINDQGQAKAVIEVQLTNRLSNIYASEFTLSIGSTNLTGISLTTPSGKLEPQISQGNQTTNIKIIFPDKVLGKDNSQQFTLEFVTTDFARRHGNIWEISIPRLARSETLSQYSLDLAVPARFGRAATLTPSPQSVNQNDGWTNYHFAGEALFRSGINATFGSVQWYDFSLAYYLKNDKLFPVETEIALPPDTAWQQVLYQTLEPLPETVRTDADGNWLAVYRLGPASAQKIIATGSATLFLEPREDYPFGLNRQINYLSPQKYWETGHDSIQSLAGELSGPRQIYDYVVDNLIYDYGRLGEEPVRLGAANTLDNRDSALCLEFTDLFVALSRAKGIPARAVNGYAFTDNDRLRPLSLNQDVLHAWPEYYDQSRDLWRPVDPTWGNTTGGVDFFTNTDLNHFAFVILGQDSAYPVPAGAYKAGDGPEKNLKIDFGRSVLPEPDLDLKFELPREAVAGVEIKGKLIAENTGNQALSNLTVSLTGDRLRLLPGTWEIAYLPPKAKAEQELTLPAGNWNDRETGRITAVSDLAIASWSISLVPAYRVILSSAYCRWAAAGLAGLIVLKLLYARIHQAKSHS